MTLHFEQDRVLSARRIGAVALMFIFFLLSFTFQVPNSSASNQTLSATSITTVSAPVYVWFFGYVGNTFYPQSELNISEQTMISTAQNLSETFGKNNLVLVTAVDQIPLPGGVINESMVSTIKSYVSSLKKYAGQVWGRLDFYQFNLTATSSGDCDSWLDCPIYNQTSMYINQLGLNGVWLDHPSQYWDTVGNVTFNNIMQNLTTLFPNTKFILNQTPGGLIGYVSELPNMGYTWENQTWVSPSPPQNQTTPNLKQMQVEYNLFPGHVLLHFDARGPPAIGEDQFEPMSIFAAENTSQETNLLTQLVYNGTHPSSLSEYYPTVIPLVGSWTYQGSIDGSPNYNGTLYNALTVGTYARSTFSAFEQLILSNNPSVTVSPIKGSINKLVSLKGYFFLPSTEISINFNKTLVASVKSASNGDFTKSFRVPPSNSGPQNITITDGINTLVVTFTVK